jgi:hypothetical protein
MHRWIWIGLVSALAAVVLFGDRARTRRPGKETRLRELERWADDGGALAPADSEPR